MEGALASWSEAQGTTGLGTGSKGDGRQPHGTEPLTCGI